MHPILVSIGPLTLPSYGFFVALGYLAAILWLKRRRSELRLTEDQFWSLIYSLFFGAIVGGKLMYLAVEWRDVLAGRIRLFADLRYGFVFFGGFIGACLMALWRRRRLAFDFAAAADRVGVALPLGHAIGRLGCLASGCCYGRPTTLPWGLRFGGSPASTTPPELWGVPLHPTQLYEAAGNAAIAAIIAWVALPRVRGGRSAPGAAFLTYVVLYALLRFGVELFRGDDRGLWRGLSVAQWTSLACLIAVAVWVIRRRRAGRTA